MNSCNDSMEMTTTTATTAAASITATAPTTTTINNQHYQQSFRQPAAASAGDDDDDDGDNEGDDADGGGAGIDNIERRGNGVGGCNSENDENNVNENSFDVGSEFNHHLNNELGIGFSLSNIGKLPVALKQHQQLQIHYQQQQHQQQQQQQQHQTSSSSQQERYVWEMRARSPNVTPASTVLNSPDLNTDVGMQYTVHHGHHMHHSHAYHHHQHQHHHQRPPHHHHPHHQIRVGHSPGSQFEQHDSILPQGLASPGSPTDVGKGDGQCLRDGEIVVFDDIDTNWMNKTSANSLVSKEATMTAGGVAYDSAASTMTTTPSLLREIYQQNALYQQSNEDVLKVTKMIGQLPIAEYEGSPRRFGNQTQMQTAAGPAAASTAATTATTTAMKSGFPKRPPGFPLRVSPTAAPAKQKLQFGGNDSTAASPASDNNNGGDGNNTSIGNLIDLIDHEEKQNAMRQAANAAVAGASSSTAPAFDYLYEFSETRKVLEEFFKANPDDEKRFTDFTESGDDVASSVDYVEDEKNIDQAYIGQRLARIPKDELYLVHRSPKKQNADENNIVAGASGVAAAGSGIHVNVSAYNDNNDIELYIDSNSRSSGDLADTELEANLRRHSRNFTLSPETTDYDSNCGDLDSLSNDINCTTDYGKLYTSMPVLEDGLSSGHASDTENNVSVVCDKQQQHQQQQQQPPLQSYEASSEHNGNDDDDDHHHHQQQQQQQQQQQKTINENEYNASLVGPDCVPVNGLISDTKEEQPSQPQSQTQPDPMTNGSSCGGSGGGGGDDECCSNANQLEASLYGAVYATVSCTSMTSGGGGGLTTAMAKQSPPPPPAPVPHRPTSARSNATTAAAAAVTSMSGGQQQQRLASAESVEIQEAMKEIRSALQRAKTQPEKLKFCDEVLPPGPDSPVWVPRKNAATMQQAVAAATAVVAAAAAAVGNHHVPLSRLHSGCLNGVAGEEEEHDTDLETDRLLGQQRLDEQDFFDDKNAWHKVTRAVVDACEQTSAAAASVVPDFGLLTGGGGGGVSGNNNNNSSSCGSNGSAHVGDSVVGGLMNNNITCGNSSSSSLHKPQAYSTATIRQGIGTSLTANSPDICQIVGNADVALTSPEKLQFSKSPTGSLKSLKDSANCDKKAKTRNKEGLLDPQVLIEGVLFRARYLGSTQLVCEGQPTKSTRMMQAEEAVSRIKAPEGESQPSTEVDLFISTEKIMVLNTDLKEIMMDHALRTISYIADIGDLVVLMARRRFVPSGTTSGISDACISDTDAVNGGSGGGGVGKDNNKEPPNSTNIASTKQNRTPKMICHVFESDEAQFIAQSIGQAFQVAYMEFLKANGIENESLAKEMDYQEVLNSQEIFGDELEIFAKKELQKEVVVPKAKGEILGVVIVESGWGSMLPTVVIANLMSGGAAARCGQLNIGDQLIAINGMSLVGLPLSTCQSYIRNAKNQTAVKFTVVPCPPVVEVKILRPKALFQLGFSVQNGVICSLLRGGIAERGGVRVGHRIIEINNQSVVAVPHDTIVKLLSSSVGEILMKTMPTSMFRLLTGQETPIYI